MHSFRLLKGHTVAAVAFFSLLANGCTSAPPKSEGYLAPKPGSTVEYRVTNTGSFGNNTSLSMMRISESTWKGQPVLRYESPTGVLLNNGQAGIVALLNPAGEPTIQYEPAFGYQWPLAVGKTWESDHVATTGAGSKVPIKASWKVEDYGDVTVPAGTFKAWRVTMTDNLGFRQTTWSVPQKMGMFAKRLSERPDGHPQGGGTQLYEMTQVPAIR